MLEGYFFMFGCAVQFAGFKFLNQGLNSGPQQLECRVLTTRALGNSLLLLFSAFIYYVFGSIRS